MVSLKAKMMVLFDTIQAAEMRGKELGPISRRYDVTTILGTDQLADVAYRRLFLTTRDKSSKELTSVS